MGSKQALFLFGGLFFGRRDAAQCGAELAGNDGARCWFRSGIEQSKRYQKSNQKKHLKQGENLHFSNPALGSAVRLHKSETF